MSVRFEVGDEAVVTVEGALDEAAALEIASAFREIIHDWPRRVELDLRGVTEYTARGAVAVSECLSVGRRLEDGINVQVATDAGCAALLSSMELV